MSIDIRELIPSEGISKKLPNWYGEKAKQQAYDIVNNWFLDNAPKRKSVYWITIDWIESKDLDDGLWVEKLKNGWYMLQISIADPSELFETTSPIGIEAFIKTTSLYFPTHVIHMIPPILSTNLASLNHHKHRLSQTIQIEYDDQARVIKSSVFESKFYNRNRFDYRMFSEHLKNPDSEYYNTLKILEELWRKLEENRLKKWAIYEEFEESKDYGELLSKLVVREAAIAWNIQACIFCVKNNIAAVFRNHMTEYGWSISTNDILARALYSTKMVFHRWLQEENYMHFTSPIRRLPDHITHEQIKAFLRGEKPKYKKEWMNDFINYLNAQRSKLEELSVKYLRKVKVVNCQREIKKRLSDWENISKWPLKFALLRALKLGIEIPDEVEGQLFSEVELADIFSLEMIIKEIINSWENLSESLKYEIIEKIKNWRWTKILKWGIRTFLCTNEFEIIEVLKHKTLNRVPKERSELLMIIWRMVPLNRDKKVFKIEEKEYYDSSWQKKIIWSIKYLWELVIQEEITVMYNKSSNEKQIFLEGKNNLRKKILERIFDYFLYDRTKLS